MPLKLTINSLRADLAAVENLLKAAAEVNDIIGKMQFQERKEEILAKLSQLESTPEKTASVALYFGGQPVLGSYGISTTFATKALQEFQSVVSNLYASAKQKGVGSRGPLPNADNSELMVTAVTKGSFGFVLDEVSSEQSDLFESKLKLVVDRAVEVIENSCAESEELFEEVLSRINNRTLGPLKEFFINLDNHAATMKIIENNHEFFLDEKSIHRGRLRTEFLGIEESDKEFSGILIGFLPEHRKFELRLPESDIVIYGPVSSYSLNQYQRMISENESVIPSLRRVIITVKKVQPLNSDPKYYYKLRKFVE